jgi:hypothetical protein
VTPEELRSEIYLKLLGPPILANDNLPELPKWTPSRDPQHDRRVIWLIQEIGGYEAIGHRYEDILRERFGRSLPGRGRRIVQPGKGDEPLEVGGEQDEHATLREEDASCAWSGLLIMGNLQFKPEDDVSSLLQLLADDPSILDNSSNTQWPISKIASLLNDRFSPPLWGVERVDNAKRRLMNWISRLMRDNGLDATDLEALFAGVARKKKAREQESIKLPIHKLANRTNKI